MPETHSNAHASSTARDLPSPLLSMKNSKQAARELQYWSMAAQRQILALVSEAFAIWRNDWDIPPAFGLARLASFTVTAPANGGPSNDQMTHVLADAIFGIGSRTTDRTSNSTDSPSMAIRVADRAWHAWLDRVNQLCGPSHDGAAPQLEFVCRQENQFDPWIGELLIAFGLPQGDWLLRVTAVQARYLLRGLTVRPEEPASMPTAAPPALTPISQALGRTSLEVGVCLDDVTMTLGQLSALSVGDVVLLSHPLVEPVKVIHAPVGHEPTQTPTVIGMGWLGQAQGDMALELLPL